MDITINQLSAATAIIVFTTLIIYKYWKGHKIILSDMVVAGIAGGMLPLALALTIYGFAPSLIKSIEEMTLQITITGLVLIFVYVETIINRAKSDSS